VLSHLRFTNRKNCFDWNRSLVDVWDKPFAGFHVVSVFISEFLQEHLLLYLNSVDCKRTLRIITKKPYKLWKSKGTEK
jgi:hypothetical protein